MLTSTVRRGALAICGLALIPAATSAMWQLGPGAAIGKLQIFPLDNPWNRDISKDPVDPDSERIVAKIGLSKPLHPDFGPSSQSGIPYGVVAGSQPRVPVRFEYPGESDPGPYP